MSETATCFHCHDELPTEVIRFDQHSFCCNGCKTVYELLSAHQLGAFYTQDVQAGQRPNVTRTEQFAFLDDPILRQQLIDFEEGDLIRLTLHLPQIHCASCIYLLEHLHKLHVGIVQSSVHFTKREATITVHTDKIKLSELAQLLSKIGYQPNFNRSENAKPGLNKRLLLQLGFAGFAFGSIMLWSFPEYLGLDKTYLGFRQLSAYLSLAVSIPVLFYSASDYFRSAVGALRSRSMNLDVPIVLGIIALYVRSTVAIFSGEGPGYMDSFAGFIFFLLIGKWFQSKTYQWLSFDRDFRSYFPVAVVKINGEDEQLCSIEKLETDDRIRIRNEEIVPCDSILSTDKVTIDYSFVTGEADWVEKKRGDLIYAGGKVIGNAAVLKVHKTTSRSALTQLWNGQHDSNSQPSFQGRQDRISRYFISVVLLLALGASIVWWFIAPREIPEIVTAILIVACPCALALSVPFVYGNMIRKLGRVGMYLRNTAIIERMQQCDTVVFDKTGTLTQQDEKKVSYVGTTLTEEERKLLFIATKNAHHPYAKVIHELLKTIDKSDFHTEEIIEYPGQGIEVKGLLKLGSASFVGIPAADEQEACSYILIKDELKGKFLFHSSIRQGMEQLVQALGKQLEIHVISGDKPRDQEQLKSFFPVNTQFHFNKQPLDKKNYIERLQQNGHRVMMIGDGLNDAGALNEAFVGIALSENLVRFTPSSDVILKAENLRYLNEYYRYMVQGKTFLKWCFAFSLVYNLTGIGFAVSGQLTPLIAAILMPLSSITVISLATLLTVRKRLPALHEE
jgi:Cu+-exporting ATPase